MSALEIAIRHYEIAHVAELDFQWTAYPTDFEASRAYLAIKEAKRQAGTVVEALKRTT